MDTERLIYMANQIARNLAVRGETAAIADTAEHIDQFWDPRMKAAVLQVAPDRLSPIARAAIGMLARQQPF